MMMIWILRCDDGFGCWWMDYLILLRTLAWPLGQQYEGMKDTAWKFLLSHLGLFLLPIIPLFLLLHSVPLIPRHSFLLLRTCLTVSAFALVMDQGEIVRTGGYFILLIDVRCPGLDGFRPPISSPRYSLLAVCYMIARDPSFWNP